MANFLLIHGAWMDQTCWAPVIQALSDQGHNAQAFDLAGHGQDQTALAEITLDRYVQQATDAASEMGRPVILVGHSMAGIVISQAAEAAPELFSQLVYVAAYLPINGQSLNDLARTDSDSGVGPNMLPATDWSTLDIVPEARADLFFHDVDDAAAAPFLDHWKAEPVGPQTAPLQLTDERFGSVPRFYVKTENDRAVSPSLQARMLEASPCDEASIATGHTPMLSDPDGLAELLARVAQ